MVKDIYSFLHPMFIVSKIVGLCPLKYNAHKRYEKTYLGLIWSLIFGSVMFSISEYTAFNYMFVYTDMIQRIISIIMVQMSLITSFLSSIIFYFNTNKIITLVNDITKIDVEFRKLNILPKDIYKSRKVILATLSVIILWLLLLIADVLNYFKSFAFKRFGNLITYTMPPLIIGLVEMQFYIYTLCLKDRFHIINKKLKDIGKCLKNGTTTTNIGKLNVKSPKNKIQPIFEISNAIIRETNVQTIEHLRKIHHKLSTCTKVLNSAYSVQILLICMCSFIAITEQLYVWVIAIYTEDPDQSRLKLLAYRGLTFFSECLEIILLAVICDQTASEAQKTGKFIFETVTITGNSYHDEKEFEVLQSFCYQLIHHKVHFTACGIFTLDKPLLYGIVGATTTYLVIVLQFELALHS